MRDGRAGYYVITPFALQGGGWVLVNRGWVPVGRQPRREAGLRRRRRTCGELRGRTDVCRGPASAWANRRALAPPYPVVAAFPSLRGRGRLLQ